MLRRREKQKANNQIGKQNMKRQRAKGREWNYRWVAKDILCEKFIFESPEHKGASLADKWEKVFQAGEISVQMSCGRAWLTCWGASRRPVSPECNVHRKRDEKYDQRGAGSNTRQNPASTHMPFYQSQEDHPLTKFSFTQDSPVVIFLRIYISIFLENNLPPTNKEQQQQ